MHHVLPLLLLALPQGDAPAATDLPEVDAHSDHGAAFDVGPRQAAVLMDNPDRVDFPVTFAPGKDHLQPWFHQGIGQLHGFFYLEAERTFRQILAEDPECSMAYWGLALANVEKPERARWFARAAWLQRGLVTKREQMYIDMIARFWKVDGPKEPKDLVEPKNPAPGDEDFGKKDDDREPWKTTKAAAAKLASDYEELIWAYPDDLEAKALFVNRIWMNRRYGIQTTSRMAVEALVQDVLENEPLHPIHHYRIHLWDSKETAEHVVDTARKCGLAWPNIAHNWHMGGHIFDKLGRHFEAAYQQEASARVDHAYMQRFWILPDEIHNFAHNNEWLTRSLRHQGRATEAIELAKNMIELPRHPSYNDVDKRGTSASYGRERLLGHLADFEQWQTLLDLCETMYLEEREDDPAGASRAYAMARAAVHVGDDERFDAALAELVRLEEVLREKRWESMDEAEAKALAKDAKAEEVRTAMADALKKHERELGQMRDRIASLEAVRDLVDGEDSKDALKALKEHKYPRVELACLVAEIAKREDDSKLMKKAVDMIESAAKSQKKRVPEQAALAWVQWIADEKDDAIETFEAMREYAALADLTQPTLSRLAPIAEAAGYEGDWRPEPPARDELPIASLEPLGPRHWSPPVGPDWTLPDAFGNEVSLSDYRGRPVLVVDFLGFGCVHCVEQLRAIAPEVQRFRDAGIDVVAIGTQEPDELAQSIGADEQASGFGFPVLCDPSAEQFKAWRAYDDFEDMELHGTYLVDANGRVRWHDVSHLPFMDIEFLLEEFPRLLALPVRGADVQAGTPEPITGVGFLEPVNEPAAATVAAAAGPNTITLTLDKAPHCQNCIADIRRIGKTIDGFVDVTATPNVAEIAVHFDRTPPKTERVLETFAAEGRPGSISPR